MKGIEKKQVTAYNNDYKSPLSGFNLRLRYMIEDFDEFINVAHDNNAETYTTAIEREIKIAS